MAERDNVEKQKLIHIIQQVPFSAEEKAQWAGSLDENGITEELLTEVHEKLVVLPAEKFSNDWMRAKFTTDLARFTRQWRMNNASRQFKHGR